MLEKVQPTVGKNGNGNGHADAQTQSIARDGAVQSARGTTTRRTKR